MKNLCRSKGESCKCLQKSTWGEGGSKSPKTGLRSLWMAPNLGAIMLDDKIEVDDGEIAAIANENILRLPLAFSSKTLKL